MLVGFMGVKGSGKDTCADYLTEHYDFVKRSFADPLKRACQELFLYTDEQIYGTIEQKEMPDCRWFGCTPRKALQYVGTELLRDNLDKIMPGLGKNVFTHHFKLWYEAEKQTNPAFRVVVADVRFQNEIDFIQNLGGIVVKLNRLSTNNQDLHSSEIELQSITTYDFLLNNDSTKENLFESLDQLLFNKFELTKQVGHYIVVEECDDKPSEYAIDASCGYLKDKFSPIKFQEYMEYIQQLSEMPSIPVSDWTEEDINEYGTMEPEVINQ